MRAIIDGDIFRYQIGSIEMENELATPYLEGTRIARMPAPVSEIEKIVDETIKHILKSTGADSYIVCLSGKGNFRLDIAKQQPYKGNRDPNQSRPYHYGTVGDHIIGNHPHIVVDGIEADDWMAIEQRKDSENNIICSRDKDLKTCYGWHYRWACGEKQPEVKNHWISEFDSKAFFFHQMLIGDNTDNICGCGKRVEMMWGGKICMRRKGIGEKAAEKLLCNCNTVQELYDVVSDCYQKEFGDDWEDVMLENARLLYIGQQADELFDWTWLDYLVERENNETLCSSVSNDKSENSYEPGAYHDGSSCGGESGSCTSIPRNKHVDPEHFDDPFCAG